MAEPGMTDQERHALKILKAVALKLASSGVRPTDDMMVLALAMEAAHFARLAVKMNHDLKILKAALAEQERYLQQITEMVGVLVPMDDNSKPN